MPEFRPSHCRVCWAASLFQLADLEVGEKDTRGGFKGEGVEPARGCLGTRGGRLVVRAVFPGLPWEGKPGGEPQ